MTCTSRDFYQTCHFCGHLVNTYNEHAVIKKLPEQHYFHVKCVENTHLEFEESEIIYVNMWCAGGVT